MMYSTRATAAPIRPMIATRTVAGRLAGPCTVMSWNYPRPSAGYTRDELDIHEWLAAGLRGAASLAAAARRPARPGAEHPPPARSGSALPRQAAAPGAARRTRASA